MYSWKIIEKKYRISDSFILRLCLYLPNQLFRLIKLLEKKWNRKQL